VIQRIVDDPLVIADLTDRNPNVFYELAVRHALRKPLVQIIRKGDPIPFDVAGMRTISVDHHDLDSVEEAKQELGRQIETVTKASARMETPISVAVELQSLRQSDDPEQRSLGELIGAVSELRTAVAGIEKRLNETSAPGSQLGWRYAMRDRDIPELECWPQPTKAEWARRELDYLLRTNVSTKEPQQLTPDESRTLRELLEKVGGRAVVIATRADTPR